jgi:hypothetical protein
VAAAGMGRNEVSPSVRVSNPRILPHFGKFRKILSPFRCLTRTADHPERLINESDWEVLMEVKMLAQALVISGFATCVAGPGFAGDNCQHVGGGVLTNFLPPSNPACAGSFQNLCSGGTTTGDLKGGVGVSVVGISGNVYHVQHHWVTESGDTIFAKDAFLTTFPTSDPNRVLADYVKGVEIAGGTGRFAGATGFLPSIFGAIDLKLGQLTLRYEGTVCFRPVAG